MFGKVWLTNSAAANLKNHALFDKSTKIGTHAGYHPINNFGYGPMEALTNVLLVAIATV